MAQRYPARITVTVPKDIKEFYATTENLNASSICRDALIEMKKKWETLIIE